MTDARTDGQLVGRQSEIGHLAELTAAACAGRGGALVLRGDAGMGKSSLLDHAGRTAPGLRVVRVSGAQCKLGISSRRQLRDRPGLGT
ncbi:AAA family ATPase [Streptomyces sp. NPDC059785]|uniref:AAA family ATPase n=1 Tax=Streptomyces sp. NPDC059785 TaxID=3346945 RepID=UPI0036540661